MKTLISTLIVCLAMIFTVGSTEARDHHRRRPHHRTHHRLHYRPAPPPPMFECKARSPYAFGFGISPYRHVAAQIALRQCAVRTPYGDICYLSWCRRIR